MDKVGATHQGNTSIVKLLDINPLMQGQLMEYGDIGENAFDVYTLYKSAAKRQLTDTIETNDAFDMQCLAWMTKEEFSQARRLLRKLGYIMETTDRGENRKTEIRQVRLDHRIRRGQ
jgi:hypothetical protein